MIEIKILKSVGGNNFSYRAGQIVKAEKNIAEDLVQAKYAEIITNPKTKVGAGK